MVLHHCRRCDCISRYIDQHQHHPALLKLYKHTGFILGSGSDRRVSACLCLALSCSPRAGSMWTYFVVMTWRSRRSKPGPAPSCGPAGGLIRAEQGNLFPAGELQSELRRKIQEHFCVDVWQLSLTEVVQRHEDTELWSEHSPSPKPVNTEPLTRVQVWTTSSDHVSEDRPLSWRPLWKRKT